MNSLPVPHDNAVSTIGHALTLGFRFLAWLNGLGVVVMLCCSMGILDVGLGAEWMRFPLAAFLGGLALGALGLMWSYSVQASLIHQVINARARRAHWIPLTCTVLAYMLSFIAFVIGCWFFQLLLESVG